MSHHHNLFPYQQDFNGEASSMFTATPPFLQFASSVPPQQVNRTSSMENVNFHQNPFSNQDPLMSHPMLSNNFPPATTYTTIMDPLFTNTVTNNRQFQQSRADRRAEHNALERARRESLNSKFQKLALSLPNLSNDTRPSKNTIIERTLDFVQDAKLKEERMRNQIEELERVNRYLLSQLDNKNITRSISRSSSNSLKTKSPSPQLDESMENNSKSQIKLEVLSSPSAVISHDKNKSDATVYHAYNQAVMQNLQYDESEDDEDITDLNTFAFRQQPFSIIPEHLQYSLMDYSS